MEIVHLVRLSIVAGCVGFVSLMAPSKLPHFPTGDFEWFRRRVETWRIGNDYAAVNSALTMRVNQTQ